jgi:NitT/TauT family transport system ATP-binding protein
LFRPKPIFDASVLLDFAEVTQGDVNLTEIGQDFATTILRSQNLFRQQVLANVPVLVSMIQTLREKRNRSMRAGFFMDLLNEYFSDKESERQFATAWFIQLSVPKMNGVLLSRCRELPTI